MLRGSLMDPQIHRFDGTKINADLGRRREEAKIALSTLPRDVSQPLHSLVKESLKKGIPAAMPSEMYGTPLERDPDIRLIQENVRKVILAELSKLRYPPDFNPGDYLGDIAPLKGFSSKEKARGNWWELHMERLRRQGDLAPDGYKKIESGFGDAISPLWGASKIGYNIRSAILREADESVLWWTLSPFVFHRLVNDKSIARLEALDIVLRWALTLKKRGEESQPLLGMIEHKAAFILDPNVPLSYTLADAIAKTLCDNEFYRYLPQA